MSSITEEGYHGKQLHDPAFKLFGTTIPVCSDGEHESGSCQDVGQVGSHSDDETSIPDRLTTNGYEEDSKNDLNSLANNPSLEREVMNTSTNKSLCNDAAHEKITRQEETIKKPEKLIPCPRCESMDTKFCYFNNYNVNQPRHFCKNCQRYWTAGGNLRNVPVGAGRRKSKPSIPLDQPESVVVRDDSPENAKNLISCSEGPSLRQTTLFSQSAYDAPSSTTAMLTFGQENHISVARKPYVSRRSDVLQGYKPDMSCTQENSNLELNFDSARSVSNEKGVDANLYDEQKPNEKTTKNTAGRLHLQPIQDSASKALDSNQASRSSDLEGINEADAMHTSVSNPSFSCMPEQSRADAMSTCVSNSSLSYMPGPWTYGPNLAWGNVNAANGNMQGDRSNSLGESNPHQPIHPAPRSLWASNADTTNHVAQLHWASLISQHQVLNNITQPPWAGAVGNPCSWPFVQHPLWWNSAWAMPWAAAAIAAAANPTLGNTTFGKRPRDSVEPDTEKSVPPLVPKTLRIDELGADAQSSIWSALGLQTKPDNVATTSMFGKFQPKVENEECVHALKSNPAAMEVSALFHESNLTL